MQPKHVQGREWRCLAAPGTEVSAPLPPNQRTRTEPELEHQSLSEANGSLSRKNEY